MGPLESVIVLVLVLGLLAVAFRFLTKNKAMIEGASVQVQLTGTRKVGEFLGHPFLELSFATGEEEGPIWSPRSFEEHPLPWDFEANPGESSPKNSHLPAIVNFQALRPDTEFGEREGFIVWSDAELNYELLIDESWFMLVVRAGEEDHESPSLNFHVGEPLDDVDVSLRVESYQPVPPGQDGMHATAEDYSLEEAQAELANLSPEVLQRIGEYCQFGGGEVIVSSNEVLLDVFVLGFDPEFLEDLFRESSAIAHMLLGREVASVVDEAW